MKGYLHSIRFLCVFNKDVCSYRENQHKRNMIGVQFFMSLILFMIIGNAFGQQGNYVKSGGQLINADTIDLKTSKIWISERGASPGYFTAVGKAVYENGRDSNFVNGYVKHHATASNQSFTFPVGDSMDYRPVSISGNRSDTSIIAVAWIQGDPSTTADPTLPHSGVHSTGSFETGLFEISDVGQWDWQDISGDAMGTKVTVSIPDMSSFTLRTRLRLVGWNGTQWVNLSDTLVANGNTEGSLLSGYIDTGITSLGIGSAVLIVTATDSLGCSGDTLPQMTANLINGTWSILTDLGSTVDSSGNVVLGINSDTINNTDTVIYSSSGLYDTVIVTIYPLTRVTAELAGNVCKSTDTLTLSETGGDGVSWSWLGPNNFKDSIQVTSFLNPVAGDYFVLVTDGNGCFGRDTVDVCSGGVTANCNAQTLIVDDMGMVTLDSLAIGNGSTSICAGIASYGLETGSLSCSDGFMQDVKLLVSDSLGCVDSCTAEITLTDTIRPVEGCLEVQQLVLVWKGLELHPSSLAGSSTDNCGNGGLTFSFDPQFSMVPKAINCKELLVGLGSMMVYMRDESGNTDSCLVEIDFNTGPGSEDCSCDWGSLHLKGILNADDYKARESVLISGQIPVGDTLTAKAGIVVVLRPGFYAPYGSRFGAKIDSCGNVAPATEGFGEAHEAIIRDDMSKNKLSDFSMSVHPNPFNEFFRVQIQVRETEELSFYLQDMQGQRVIKLLEKAVFSPGVHEFTVDASRLPGGAYILSTTVRGETFAERLISID